MGATTFDPDDICRAADTCNKQNKTKQWKRVLGEVIKSRVAKESAKSKTV